MIQIPATDSATMKYRGEDVVTRLDNATLMAIAHHHQQAIGSAPKGPRKGLEQDILGFRLRFQAGAHGTTEEPADVGDHKGPGG